MLGDVSLDLEKKDETMTTRKVTINTNSMELEGGSMIFCIKIYMDSLVLVASTNYPFVGLANEAVLLEDRLGGRIHSFILIDFFDCFAWLFV